MPTVEELNALTYPGSAAFASGLTGADFRAQLQGHGQPFRWWKAWRVENNASTAQREANGRIYVEQKFPEGSDVKALFYNTTRDIFHPELGPVPKGHTAISVMPDECELVYLDRIAPTTFKWLERQIVRRAQTGDDQLLHKAATEILTVMVGGLVKPANTYKLESGGKLKWLSSAPEPGVEYSVEYRYHPLFEFMGNEQGVVQIGKDGAFLPQRGLIRLMKPSGRETTY